MQLHAPAGHRLRGTGTVLIRISLLDNTAKWMVTWELEDVYGMYGVQS
jgi:hypothetical protein